MSSSSSSQKGQDNTSRFASLLQPLRDLADNWNIDIARELEDYIELLEGATFTVGDGGQRLNFAEGLLHPFSCFHSLTISHALYCTLTLSLQPHLSSRALRSCTARRSSISTTSCSRRSSTSLRTRSAMPLLRLLLVVRVAAATGITTMTTTSCGPSTTPLRVCFFQPLPFQHGFGITIVSFNNNHPSQ